MITEIRHGHRRTSALGFVVIANLALTVFAASCGSPERANPVDPAVTGELPQQTMTLLLALPKSLATVIDRIVAKLVGPDMPEIVKELSHSPLGPASLTIGAITPGANRTLTIEGYDLQGRLIMVGEKRNLTIAVGDTTRVTIELVLTDQFVPEEIVTGDDGDTETGGEDQTGDGTTGTT